MLAIGYNFWTEWEAEEKVYLDGVNKIIYVYPHVSELDIRTDVWSAYVRWNYWLGRDYDRFGITMERTGLDAIPGGQTGDFYFLTNGWKMYIDLAKVKVTGVLYSRDFDTAYYNYDGEAVYPAEVSSIVNVYNSSNGGSAGVDANAIAQAVWDHVTRTLTQQTIDEAELHDALDSYPNKDGWKADSVMVDSQSVANAVWGASTRGLTETIDLSLEDSSKLDLIVTNTSGSVSIENTDIHNALDSYLNKDNWKATQGLTAADLARLDKLNDNVKKASILVPATQDLS